MFLYQLYRRLSIKAAQLISLHGRIAPAIVIMLSAVSAQAQIAQTPDGYWQHPEDPVWIEVLLQAGTGIALRNDDQPETVGFHVVKDLAATDEPGIWQGQVFVPQLDGYKKVTITMPDDQTLRMTVKFGFFAALWIGRGWGSEKTWATNLCHYLATPKQNLTALKLLLLSAVEPVIL